MADAVRFSVGTSGFAYDAWRGPFYPEDLPARERLRFYAERLPAVEINHTFYRMPKPAVLRSWAGQVPEGFRFAIKASRRITHHKRLKSAEDETEYLLRTVSVLGDRLGALLFQLPPNLRADLERLDAFLDLLPEGTPAAFELRHPSWEDEAVLGRLRERGFARVVVDAEGAEPPEPLATAGFAYLRLRREDYGRADLVEWAARIRESSAREAFVFFKHEDAGAGPRLAAELRATVERAEGRRSARAAGPARGRSRRRDAS